MKVTQVSYKQLKNTGNFEHQAIEVVVDLEDGDTPHNALERCRAFVAKELAPKTDPREFASAEKILANPKAYTGYQVEEAEKLMALLKAQEETPF